MFSDLHRFKEFKESEPKTTTKTKEKVIDIQDCNNCSYCKKTFVITKKCLIKGVTIKNGRVEAYRCESYLKK
ncbi:hypothetical protein N356_gp012 [Cellulophaga phage phi14:2]|uniref:Uncharacterized protein n=1 Tax=Cellulophaga phage phi14:2 TaxID=1327990 RepID=S0A378_9CAUD|nr:hypothetical protein N356_gp012 [Cellulophaga phage phi14:2]AGO48902.1 hypothetical protein Phi14:2_gp024 [Cellulophaga phage phi14:2]